MIALIKDNTVVGFLVEESQKAAFDPAEYSFIDFEWEWPTNNPPMISDATVVNGSIVWLNK